MIVEFFRIGPEVVFGKQLHIVVKFPLLREQEKPLAGLFQILERIDDNNVKRRKNQNQAKQDDNVAGDPPAQSFFFS